MQHADGMRKLTRLAFLAMIALVIMTATVWGIRLFALSRHQTATPTPNAANMAIGGFPMNGDLAPDFTLTDQFGQSVTLSSLRGHEVVLAFIDSRCKDVCPLTATIMYSAKAALGPNVSSQIDLVAINANPNATSVAEIQAWSIAHGMLHQWEFLTGPAQQLWSTYHLYNAYVQVSSNGAIVHDPLTFIIDATGHERLKFETLEANDKADLNDQEVGLEDGMRQWLPQPQ